MSRMLARFLLCLLAIGALLAGCIGSPALPPLVAESPLTYTSPVPSATATKAAPTAVPALVSEAGKASITGTIYTYTGGGPIPGVNFYLLRLEDGVSEPPVMMSGARPEQGDVRGQSRGDGFIALTDVPPGRYLIAIWAPYNWLLAVESPTDETPRLVVLAPDQQLDLGTIFVAWP